MLPNHIAIIMDGNGRWAKMRKRERTYGHRQGVETVRAVVRASREIGIKNLSLFTFSSENWQRPKLEVQALFKLFTGALNKYLDELIENEVCLRFIGDRSELDNTLIKKIRSAEEATSEFQNLRLNIALNYGGRWDIANAFRTLMQSERPDNNCEQIEQQLNRYFEQSSVGDVDLLIRTAGEQRISNFFLWQCAYAELYFTDKLWPEFTKEDLNNAVEWFASRERKFGTVK